MKAFYITVVILYLLLHIIYFLRFEISYRIVKVRPELVEIRSLTDGERRELDKAYDIRVTISNIFLYSSIFVAIVSILVKRQKLFDYNLFVKIIIAISVGWSILLLLVGGIHFIPTGPLVQ